MPQLIRRCAAIHSRPLPANRVLMQVPVLALFVHDAQASCVHDPIKCLLALQPQQCLPSVRTLLHQVWAADRRSGPCSYWCTPAQEALCPCCPGHSRACRTLPTLQMICTLGVLLQVHITIYSYLRLADLHHLVHHPSVQPRLSRTCKVSIQAYKG